MTLKRITDFNIRVEPGISIRSADETIQETLVTGSIYTEPFELPIDRESVHLDRCLETIEHLTALRDSIKRYGLTRSLISFADYNKALSDNIKAIPALESLTADKSVKNSTDAIAALEAGIVDHVDLFIRKLKARAKNFIARIFSNIEKLDSNILHIKTMRTMLDEGRVIDSNQAKTKKFRLLNRKELFYYFGLAAKEADFSAKLASLKLPDSEAEYKKWMTTISKEFNAIDPDSDTGFSLNEYGRLELKIGSQPEVGYNTLDGAGYTLDDFDPIAAEFPKTEKFLKGFRQDLSRIAGLLNMSHNDPTMIYIHKAANLSYDIIWSLAVAASWNTSVAGLNVLRGIFACSVKK